MVAQLNRRDRRRRVEVVHTRKSGQAWETTCPELPGFLTTARGLGAAITGANAELVDWLRPDITDGVVIEHVVPSVPAGNTIAEWSAASAALAQATSAEHAAWWAVKRKFNEGNVSLRDQADVMDLTPYQIRAHKPAPEWGSDEWAEEEAHRDEWEQRLRRLAAQNAVTLTVSEELRFIRLIYGPHEAIDRFLAPEPTITPDAGWRPTATPGDTVDELDAEARAELYGWDDDEPDPADWDDDEPDFGPEDFDPEAFHRAPWRVAVGERVTALYTSPLRDTVPDHLHPRVAPSDWALICDFDMVEVFNHVDAGTLDYRYAHDLEPMRRPWEPPENRPGRLSMHGTLRRLGPCEDDIVLARFVDAHPDDQEIDQ